HALAAGLAGAFLLGAGTSLVYPTLLAAVSDATHPDWRAAAPGVYPFLRGSRYPLRAPIRRLPAPPPPPPPPPPRPALLPPVSGLLAWLFMHETHPRLAREATPADRDPLS